MTDIPETPATPAPDWQPLPRGAGTVAAIAGALGALPFAIGLSVLASAVGSGLAMKIGLAAAALVLLPWLGAVIGRARWRRTHWRLDQRGLQVRRGLVWRKEILVPRSRVQHLDIERGPIERRFGLATLVAHTAGTRMHALRQAGLAEADAVALRDALLPEPDRHDDSL